MDDASELRREVERCLASPEGAHLEFKEAATAFDKDKALRYCAALANEGGGMLVLGVRDSDHEPIGTRAFRNPREMERSAYEELGRTIHVRVREVELRGKRLVVFSVPPRPRGRTISFKGLREMRAGESLVSMSDEVLRTIMQETAVHPLNQTVLDWRPVVELENVLDVASWFDVRNKPRPADGGVHDLHSHRLLKMDPTYHRARPTRLGLAVLGISLQDDTLLSQHRIRVVRYDGSSRLHAIRDRLFEHGYLRSFTETMDFILTLCPRTERIGGLLREESLAYPEVAIREFLANAIVHQDFEVHSSAIMVEIFDDRMEITNPGVPKIEITRFVDSTAARNPELAETMRQCRICERRGSGIDRALAEIERLGKPAPTFTIQSEATTVRMQFDLPFASMSRDERCWAAYWHCCLMYESGSRMTNSTLRQRFGLSDENSKRALVSQAILAAIEMQLVVRDPRTGTSRRGAAYVPAFAVAQPLDPAASPNAQ